MTAEDIVRAWKNGDDEENKEQGVPTSPVGDADVDGSLSDEQLANVSGGLMDNETNSHYNTCSAGTCSNSCYSTKC